MSAFGAAKTFHEVSIPSTEALLATTYGQRDLECFGQAGFGDKSLALPWEKTHEDRPGSIGKGGENMTHFPCGHRWQLHHPAHVSIFLRDVLRLPLCELIRSCPNQHAAVYKYESYYGTMPPTMPQTPPPMNLTNILPALNPENHHWRESEPVRLKDDSGEHVRKQQWHRSRHQRNSSIS
jgi:hypothetical protein